MELTQEYFDKQFSLLTGEISGVKNDIAELRVEMNTKFDAVLELLDVRKQVEELKTQMQEVRQELKLA